LRKIRKVSKMEGGDSRKNTFEATASVHEKKSSGDCAGEGGKETWREEMGRRVANRVHGRKEGTISKHPNERKKLDSEGKIYRARAKNHGTR